MIEYFIGCSLAIVLILFLKYPAPTLSTHLQEWKNKGNFIKFKNNYIFYIDEEGTGSCGSLVCLHGFPSSSYDWIKILPKLREQFSRVIMLDFLGFGFSDKPQSYTYTIGEQADIVENLLMTLHIAGAHVLSHDYGDTVALELLARYNMQQSRISIKSLTLLNGGIFPDTHHPRPAQKLLLMPVLGYLASHLYTYHLFCRGFGAIFGKNKPSTEDFMDFWATLRYNDGDKATVRVINFLRERQAFRDRWVGALRQTAVNVLMLYGPADPVNPQEFAQHFVATVPQHKLVTLATDIGHYPQWEAPLVVEDQITNFINSIS
ncbi:mesoderm-specific transcript protein-like [Plakobranchus ocellatus]|uniref:Mesoderm-specific transcript protein-like n=1 Tax=Plakobranchus ocellatus TaxID=259542 RepID=A0AAV4CIE7_9GAST|nr:mesoderm-specific transcript protein-like [Plakobranchus ocellatus]